jgi:hypothetical protein
MGALPGGEENACCGEPHSPSDTSFRLTSAKPGTVYGPSPDDCLRWGAKVAAKTSATLVAALGVLCAFQLASHPSFLLAVVLGTIGGSVGHVAGWFFYRALIGASVSVSLALWALAAGLACLVVRVFTP